MNDVDRKVSYLQDEVARLKQIEVKYLLAQEEIKKLRAEVSELLIQKSTLRDQLEGAVSDISLMEEMIRELRSQEV